MTTLSYDTGFNTLARTMGNQHSVHCLLVLEWLALSNEGMSHGWQMKYQWTQVGEGPIGVGMFFSHALCCSQRGSVHIPFNHITNNVPERNRSISDGQWSRLLEIMSKFKYSNRIIK